MHHRTRVALSGFAIFLPLLALLVTRVTVPPTHASTAGPPSATPTTNPLPTPTTSSVLPDQEQRVFNGGLSVRFAATQTVTVGKSGSLLRVDLPLCSPSKNADVELTVSGTGAQGPTPTAKIIFQHSYSDCNWYPFDFNQPISASVGEVLTLTVTTTNHKAALWGKDGAGGDPYPHGVGHWRGLTINDFAFRTYVQ